MLGSCGQGCSLPDLHVLTPGGVCSQSCCAARYRFLECVGVHCHNGRGRPTWPCLSHICPHSLTHPPSLHLHAPARTDSCLRCASIPLHTGPGGCAEAVGGSARGQHRHHACGEQRLCRLHHWPGGGRKGKGGNLPHAIQEVRRVLGRLICILLNWMCMCACVMRMHCL